MMASQRLLGPPLNGSEQLSRISEGSDERSAASSYYSAVSGALSSSRQTPKAGMHATGSLDRQFCTAAGAIRLPQAAPSGGSSAGARPSGPVPPPNPGRPTLDMVRAFVEAGVRGRALEVLRRSSEHPWRPMLFKLRRQVDAFEMVSVGDGGSASVQLVDVTRVNFGGTREVALAPEDAPRAVVMELRDGRCLGFRLPSPAEADAFGSCLQLLADEARREGGTGRGGG